MVFALRSVGRRVAPQQKVPFEDVGFERVRFDARGGLTKETAVLLQQPIRRRELRSSSRPRYSAPFRPVAAHT